MNALNQLDDRLTERYANVKLENGDPLVNDIVSFIRLCSSTLSIAQIIDIPGLEIKIVSLRRKWIFRLAFFVDLPPALDQPVDIPDNIQEELERMLAAKIAAAISTVESPDDRIRRDLHDPKVLRVARGAARLAQPKTASEQRVVNALQRRHAMSGADLNEFFLEVVFGGYENIGAGVGDADPRSMNWTLVIQSRDENP